ncbi:MAG: HAD hydrolase-like protein [Gammaproteobacteria bacterium]
MPEPAFDVLGFDFDGTLVDSAPALEHALTRSADRFDIDLRDVDLCRLGALSLNDYAMQLGIGADEFEEFKRYFSAVFDSESFRFVEKKSGVDELLNVLAPTPAGQQLFVLTNRRIESVRQILAELGINEFGDRVWSASEQPAGGNRKRSVLSRIVCEHYKASRVAYAGDAVEDVEAALHCDVTPIYVNDRHTAADWQSVGFAPHFRFEDLNALTKFLKGQRK